MSRRLLALGGWDPVSPRNRVLRDGLLRHGVEMREVSLSGRVWSRARALRRLTDAELEWADLLFLPKVAQHNAPAAGWRARRARLPLVADFFASLHLSEIVDRRNGVPISLRALRTWVLDRLLAAGADHFIADTAAHRDLLAERYGLPADRTTVIPVGAEPVGCGPPRPRAAGAPLRVLLVGHYIPLHGIRTVLEAAERLGGEGIHFTLIGDGQERPAAEEFVASRRLSHVKFLPPVPYGELTRHLGHTDTVLGIFGEGIKARVVMPKKAYLALAAGRCLVTADTPASRERLRTNETAILVPPGDPAALADALIALRDEPATGARLADAGRRLYRAEFTPERVAERFLDIPVWRSRSRQPLALGGAA